MTGDAGARQVNSRSQPFKGGRIQDRWVRGRIPLDLAGVLRGAPEQLDDLKPAIGKGAAECRSQHAGSARQQDI